MSQSQEVWPEYELACPVCAHVIVRVGRGKDIGRLYASAMRVACDLCGVETTFRQGVDCPVDRPDATKEKLP